ncbi:HD domain-containing phosphohydrolase [Clostridium sp.]|uniref:HD domain-containing phosphohydrolase n=1 Tax=Clostridium sp. TaxID=1506 RepID=UPI001A4C2888|nr:HD domain-containing phosphohydrolase [Clostridium sp.]MBK5242210.1 HD domain-containing protein [Clostridium sp.]
MQGLYLGQNESCLEKVTQDFGELRLIGKGDGAEIMIQKIESEQVFFIEPSDSNETLEFFYVLEGSINCERDSENIVLNKGEYFYAHGLKETVSLKTITEVTMLYLSTEPFFHYLSKGIKELSSMVKSVEEKDIYTHSHGERVRDYSINIAKILGLSSERLENIAFASLCHDVGKIFVPNKVLNKPGNLTEGEFNLIKNHPLDGEKMTQGTFMKNISKIISQHHERIDGTGYPRGLKGDEILLEAKIIALADSFDAMTSDRSYRKAMDMSVAFKELKSLSGIHYDEKVVEAFEKVLKEENLINN